jgi:hypothetical protein
MLVTDKGEREIWERDVSLFSEEVCARKRCVMQNYMFRQQ